MNWKECNEKLVGRRHAYQEDCHIKRISGTSGLGNVCHLILLQGFGVGDKRRSVKRVKMKEMKRVPGLLEMGFGRKGFLNPEFVVSHTNQRLL